MIIILLSSNKSCLNLHAQLYSEVDAYVLSVMSEGYFPD